MGTVVLGPTMSIQDRRRRVKVRIGVAESSKVVELEIDDAAAFESTVSDAVGGGQALLWVEDSKQRRVGIPSARIAYVEIETDDDKPSVGFGR